MPVWSAHDTDQLALRAHLFAYDAGALRHVALLELRLTLLRSRWRRRIWLCVWHRDLRLLLTFDRCLWGIGGCLGGNHWFVFFAWASYVHAPACEPCGETCVLPILADRE